MLPSRASTLLLALGAFSTPKFDLAPRKSGRLRIPGKPGVPGAKMRRYAEEKRLDVRNITSSGR